MDTDDFKRGLGDALQIRRRARGLTQEGLAEAVDSSTEWISQVERGIGMPSVELVLRLAHALDCGVVELVQAATSATGRSRAHEELAVIAGSLAERDLEVLLATARAMAGAQG